jgi:hypothetical protein
MKKFAIAMLTALSFGAFAADFVSVSVEHVTDRSNSAKSTVEYVRAGKEINGLQYGLQSRSARSNDGTGLYSSLEGSVGKNYSVVGLNVTPFIGAGRDLSKNGATEPYTYGFVGTNVGKPVLGGYALAGVKSRAGSTEGAGRTKQTLMYAEYSYPVAKNLFLTAGVTRSTQDIRERAVALGVAVGF